MNKPVIINDVEYRQSNIAKNLMIGKNGTYYFIKPYYKSLEGIRQPTKMYDKRGYPTQAAVCIGNYKDENGKIKTKVINFGKLVLDAFGVNQPDSAHNEVDHINRNPYDNNLENLRWCTHAENMRNRNFENLKKSHTEYAQKLGFKNFGEFLHYCRDYKEGKNDGARLKKHK